MNSRQWTVVCRDFAGRERTLRVVVRGSDVVIVAPAGEIAVLDNAAADQFRSVVKAAEVATTPTPGAPGRRAETGRAGTAEQYNDDGVPPAVEGRPALPPYRGGTTTPITWSRHDPPTRGERG